jgi:Outer membrane protein beta-barrel domain
MKKITASFAALLLLTGFVNAQNSAFGFHTGTSISKIVGKENDESQTLKNLFSVQAGFIAEFPVSKKISIQSGVNYLQKGGNLTEDIFGATAEVKMLLHTIEIPVYALYNTRSTNGNFFIGAGPAVSFTMSGNTTIKYDGEEEKEKMTIGNDAENDDIRAFDFGMNVLAGYQFKSGIFIGASHNFGFRNMIPGSDADRGTAKTSYYAFRIGYMFGKK